ncbi:HNH endonuclease OS=Bosea thiooxidans OX=53254 GN=SAMN05660750_03367 PE=4 SV=1 [Bosea thiooxidans]|uniref:HNH endonuclease n=1 Tax=Bosea thiooxidans TaxID=53254 RepID=A0A1T5FML2_9HYPH|nr:HNH endonuclease [Bosea thiooxidans]SKB97403.1 HNH endonuclease [Bosea thiooxidans]
MKKSAFNLDAFKAWLTDCGAVLIAPTSQWEILRVQTCDGVQVVYRNAKDVQTWPEPLVVAREAFERGNRMSLSPDMRARKKLRHLVEEIAARDGLWCWFCEAGFLGPDSGEVTIEHLVAKSHGGPDHLSNLVIACKGCNGLVGHMSVSEKVAIRDRKRGYAAVAA